MCLVLTIASVVGLLPQAFIGLFAGVWIDRFNRKTIMIVADSVVALSSLFLFVAFSLGFSSVNLVYGILFIRALGETFHKPALQAVIPSIVPADQLTQVGGMGQFISSATTMLGPMLGALLMSIASLPYVMLIDVVGAVIAVSILSVLKIKESHRDSNQVSTFFSDLKDGFRTFKSNKHWLEFRYPCCFPPLSLSPLEPCFH